MSYLANHPTLGLCVIDGNTYTSLGDALVVNRNEVNKLLEVGDIHSDVIFVGERCYSGEPSCKFWVNTPTLYPTPEEVGEVTSICADFGAKLMKRSFGNYEFMTYTEELIDNLDNVLEDRHHNWEVVKAKRPTPVEAVLSVPEIQQSIVEDIPEESVSMLTLSDLVPSECRGETWAFSDSLNVVLDDITDDGYCIENNWEPRGDYWIFDSIPRRKRLIHSDVLSYNKEFSIEICG